MRGNKISASIGLFLSEDLSRQKMNSLLQKIVSLVLTIALGIVTLVLTTVFGFSLVLTVQNWRTEYWLLEDGQRGVALITNPVWSGHGVFEYEYVVNQKTYTGRSRRNWEEEKYRNVGVGGKSVVYFSTSHPWLSALYKPDVGGWRGPAVIFVALLFGFFLVMTVIYPKSKWAFNIASNRRNQTGTKKEN